MTVLLSLATRSPKGTTNRYGSHSQLGGHAVLTPKKTIVAFGSSGSSNPEFKDTAFATAPLALISLFVEVNRPPKVSSRPGTTTRIPNGTSRATKTDTRMLHNRASQTTELT